MGNKKSKQTNKTNETEKQINNVKAKLNHQKTEQSSQKSHEPSNQEITKKTMDKSSPKSNVQLFSENFDDDNVKPTFNHLKTEESSQESHEPSNKEITPKTMDKLFFENFDNDNNNIECIPIIDIIVFTKIINIWFSSLRIHKYLLKILYILF